MGSTPASTAPEPAGDPGEDRPTRFDRQGFLVLLLVFVAVVWLWEAPIVAPLRLFVVFLHEAGHALAAVLTGGRVVEIAVFENESGHCVTQGGSAVVIRSAGYLGSLFLGSAILLLTTRTRHAPTVALVLGCSVVMAGLAYMPTRFGQMFALAFGGCLAVSSHLPRVWAETALRLIGVTSCLYVIVDVKGDVIERHGAPSDAQDLAEATGIPALAWGVLWIVVSVVITLLVGKWSCMRPSGGQPDDRTDGARAGSGGDAEFPSGSHAG